MGAIIEVRHLTKSYGRSRGVLDLTFEVREGEIFGFLGPNGAGKTTTIRVLMGLLCPTAGSASIAGLDCWRRATDVHRLTGYLPGEYSFDPSLTGGQILQYMANLRGGVDQESIRRLVERFELDSTRCYREYSHGNKQKVGLIQAFMHRPRVLILDEPTIGLDPLNQQEFYNLVREVRDEGRTVFLSSHILSEVEHTCDRIGIIREGRLADMDTVANLKEIKSHGLDLSFPQPTSPEPFASLPRVLSVTADRGGRELHLMVQGEVREVIRAAADHDATNIATHEPTLEEIFLRLYATPPASETAQA